MNRPLTPPTPWGPSQTDRIIAPGIVSVTTASHGGIYVDNGHLLGRVAKRFPNAFKGNGFAIQRRLGWFEEDCDWSLVYVALEEEILRGGDQFSEDLIERGSHRACAAYWFNEDGSSKRGALQTAGAI